MMETDKESWERIRVQGQNRFMLRSIIRAAWILAIISFLLELGLSLAGHHVIIWEAIIRWAILSLAIGGNRGLVQWRENEKQDQKMQGHEDPH